MSQTQDQLQFFLAYLNTEGMLTDEASEQVKDNSQKVVNEFLRRNGNFPRDIGA